MQPSEGNPPTMGATLYGKGVLEPVGPFCFLLMVNVVLEHLSHNTCEPLYFGRQCFLHGLRLLYCYQYSNLLGEISERKWYIATIFLGFFTITSLYNCRSLLNQVTSKRDIIQFAESDFIVNKTWFFSDRLGLRLDILKSKYFLRQFFFFRYVPSLKNLRAFYETSILGPQKKFVW